MKTMTVEAVRRVAAVLLLVVALSACRQTYWYCWDDPERGDPHHLGYHVEGDHLCSDDELREADFE